MLAACGCVGAVSQAAVGSNRTVVLLGDSLINHPWQQFNLSSKLDAMVNQPINWINSGNNGEEIASIEARTAAVLAQYQPWAVILFWDSDCSNVNESALTPAEVVALRANYTSNLVSTIKTVLTYGAKMAVAGPELLGEGPVGLPSRFANKTQMLDDYRDMTRSAALSLGVPYIDMRQAFLNALPAWWFPYCCRVTKDGEHPNDLGTDIEATAFSQVVNIWLTEASQQ